MPSFRDRMPLASTPRAARSIQRILDAAARLFGREGYQGASMTAVAKAAGVSKGLLHYHFQSKEHLLIEAQRATFRQIHARFDERFARGEHGMDTALEALDVLWESIRDMQKWAPFMVETMSLAAQQGPVREHIDAFYDETHGLLLEGIERVFETQLGELTIPPERLARVVRVTVHGMLIELAYARDDADLQRLDQTYRDLRELFAEVVLTSSASPEQEVTP